MCDRVEQGGDEQRVAAGGDRDGGAERIVGLEAEPLPREPGDRRELEGSRLDDKDARVAEQLAEQRRVPALLGRAGGCDHGEWNPFEPANEVGEEVQ